MAQRATRIVTDESVKGGEPRVEGRRITVRHLRSLVEEAGLSAQEVADRHDLDVADVYRALAYYHEHPDEMEDFETRDREREECARANDARTLAEIERERDADGE